MSHAIELENVTIRYGQQVAVDGLSLTIAAGEMFGLLGPNGSGKSTTLAAVAGLLDPAEGAVRINGLTHRDDPARYAASIGFVPQESSLYEELSILDNLDFFASLFDIPRDERRRRIESLLEQVELMSRARDRVGALSGGLKQRVNVAAALVHQPSVLLLDEPTASLDAESREAFFHLLHEQRGQGRTILLTTHHHEEAERWCDRVGVLREGRLESTRRPTDSMPISSAPRYWWLETSPTVGEAA